MWVESRPARSKPEGVTSSRHADQLISVHTTMLPSFFPSRASAYWARFSCPCQCKKQDHYKMKKICCFLCENRAMEWMLIIWWDNCNLIFRVNTQVCVSVKARLHINWAKKKQWTKSCSTLQGEKRNSNSKSHRGYFPTKNKMLGKSLDRGGSEGSIGYSQSAGRKPAPQKIPYHEASQPPNSKIQAAR